MTSKSGWYVATRICNIGRNCKGQRAYIWCRSQLLVKEKLV